TTLGTLVSGVGPEPIETLAYSGYDWVLIDQMLSAIGWGETAHLIRAAEASGIVPLVRLSNNPWVGASDPHLPANAMRALSIGAGGVAASVSGIEEASYLAAIARDWHRRIWVTRFKDSSEFADRQEAAAESALVIPLIESL